LARGRMISKSLSTSERRARLHEECPKLAEFCQALYPLLVAHADDWGCLPGDVFTVKHLVDPTSPRKLPEFETALKALHNVGLIVWYEADDRRIVAIRAFAAHQQLRGHDKDGRKRQFPAPPENVSEFEHSAQKRPDAPKSALREEKRTEEKRKDLLSPAADAEGTAEAGGEQRNGEVRAFLARFCELYSKYRFGAKYAVRSERDVPIVRKLLGVYGRERLEKLAQILVRTDDEWICQTDRGIGILSTKASWLDSLLAEREAQKAKQTA
jgi:hypothetical protein